MSLPPGWVFLFAPCTVFFMGLPATWSGLGFAMTPSDPLQTDSLVAREMCHSVLTCWVGDLLQLFGSVLIKSHFVRDLFVKT